jgi:hypothetical protein
MNQERFLKLVVFSIFERINCEIVDMLCSQRLCSQRTEKCKSKCKIFKHVFFPKTHKKDFFVINYFKCLTEIMVKYNMVKILWQFFVLFATEGWFWVYGKTRILLGNPDIPIERSHKKKSLKKKSKMNDALVQKIQLDEHGKFRCYVMFATMDMPIYILLFPTKACIKGRYCLFVSVKSFV